MVNVTVKNPEVSVSVSGTVMVSGANIPTYDGAYEVTPKAEQAQTLETAGRKMRDNVTVQKIPYFETANDAGGETLFIASEV